MTLTISGTGLLASCSQTLPAFSQWNEADFTIQSGPAALSAPRFKFRNGVVTVYEKDFSCSGKLKEILAESEPVRIAIDCGEMGEGSATFKVTHLPNGTSRLVGIFAYPNRTARPLIVKQLAQVSALDQPL
ncbi:hypothetical protein V6767_06530 [Martelella sp. FLE1502]